MSEVLVTLPTDGAHCGACPHKRLWTLMKECVGLCGLFGGDLFRPATWPEGIEHHRAVLRCQECLEAERAATVTRTAWWTVPQCPGTARRILTGSGMGSPCLREPCTARSPSPGEAGKWSETRRGRSQNTVADIREATIAIYYCPHCGRHYHRRYAAVRHEAGCIQNPDRTPVEGELAHGRPEKQCPYGAPMPWHPIGEFESVWVWHNGKWVRVKDKPQDWDEMWPLVEDPSWHGYGDTPPDPILIKFVPAAARWRVLVDEGLVEDDPVESDRH